MTITIADIADVVASEYGLPVAVLRGRRRSRKIAHPRMLAMALARELTDRSLPEIGRFFSRDHTTVIHACRRIGDGVLAHDRERIADGLLAMSHTGWRAKVCEELSAANVIAVALIGFGELA